MLPLPELIQALLEPGAYPDAPLRVSLVQTGNSLVFFVGAYAYKVKKPVNLGYLDYSTLEKRRFFCEREVTLNRRLCPDAYLGVLPITYSGGRVRVGGEGEAIEYAVKMRYLPQERMLNVLLGKNQVTAEMMTAVARTMAEFHEKAETGPDINNYGSLEIITSNCQENFSRTEKYIGNAFSAKTYAGLKRYTGRFIEANTGLFNKRVAGGRIRDCHGDLHARHVCFAHSTISPLLPPLDTEGRGTKGQARSTGSGRAGQGDDICIFDCIEFNDRFRYCDIASEIAFLAMDLDDYGHPDLSQTFVDAYVSLSGDTELLKLLDFYKCYRACVRGKVAVLTIDDSLISAEERSKNLAEARKYFELAETYTS